MKSKLVCSLILLIYGLLLLFFFILNFIVYIGKLSLSILTNIKEEIYEQAILFRKCGIFKARRKI